MLQLIIHVPFALNVRIKSVLLKLGMSRVKYAKRHDIDSRLTGRGDLTPQRMRIYANRANIVDFSDVDDIQPSLDISLLEGETGVTEYPLRAATFASINSLSLFFVSILQIPHNSAPLMGPSHRVILWAKKALGYTISVSRVKPERYGRRAAASSRYLLQQPLMPPSSIDCERKEPRSSPQRSRTLCGSCINTSWDI